ncbi:MAG: hypothetical protein AMJ77_05075 [Dehalococcoidia bacterium SM23_28_2]|nr:MAG: hypothetical protein AMJ77_05075 [Dehalococcoidia bacterium SM23_28_2]
MPQLPEWARERADGQWYTASAAEQPPQQANGRASAILIVVSDQSKDDWSKARAFDDPGEAAALIETLVNKGLSPELVTVFSGAQMDVDVAYRPVVEFKELKERRRKKKSRT